MKMNKKRIIKADRRYLIYYTFDGEEAETASGEPSDDDIQNDSFSDDNLD